MARTTLSTLAWTALPLVEKLSSATFGSTCRKAAAVPADAMATSASCSAVGSGMTPQSAKTSAPPAPTSVLGKTMRKQPDTLVTPLAGPMPWRAARTVAAVVEAQPATQPSASPAATMSEANSSGLATAARAASSVSSHWRRRSRYRSAKVSRRSAMRSASARMGSASPSPVRMRAASCTRGSSHSGRTIRRGLARARSRMRVRTALAAGADVVVVLIRLRRGGRPRPRLRWPGGTGRRSCPGRRG